MTARRMLFGIGAGPLTLLRITFANVGLSVSDPTDSGGNTVEGIFDSIRFS